MHQLPERVALIFDGECGFCTRVVRLVQALDRHQRVRVLPFQQPGVAAAAGLTLDQCRAAAWVVTADGRQFAGAAALNLAVAMALGTRLPLWLYGLPVVRQLEDGAYTLVARHRHRLPGSTPYCAQHPQDCR